MFVGKIKKSALFFFAICQMATTVVFADVSVQKIDDETDSLSFFQQMISFDKIKSGATGPVNPSDGDILYAYNVSPGTPGSTTVCSAATAITMTVYTGDNCDVGTVLNLLNYGGSVTFQTTRQNQNWWLPGAGLAVYLGAASNARSMQANQGATSGACLHIQWDGAKYIRRVPDLGAGAIFSVTCS